MIEISYKTKQVILWVLVLIGMILHFNYHVSGIFYGIDVVKPGSNGVEPTSLFIIRTVFYHLPFLWIVMIMYTNSRLADLCLLIISGIYAIANAFHVFGELTKDEKNASQISLLVIVFLLSVLLAFEHYRLFKTHVKIKEV